MKTNAMKTNTTLTKRIKRGFTLIEVIAVLVLLGILAAIAVAKYIDMAASARDKAIDAGVSEMNGREALTWGNNMLADGGWTADALPADTNLNTGGGTDYAWSGTDPTPAGGTLTFQTGSAIPLTRTPSTGTQPAVWTR